MEDHESKTDLNELWHEFERLAQLVTTARNPLDDLALEYGTDKSPTFHNFTRYYYRHFVALKDRARNVLELGVKDGASLKMWAEFFPNANIFGIDNDPDSFKSDSGRIRTFLGDQTNPDFLAQVIEAASEPFDIVIDDGGHRMQEQLLCLQTFFPKLNPRVFTLLKIFIRRIGISAVVASNALERPSKE